MEGRGVFGSKIAIVLATAGSAVGLGNVWRFPFMTGQNGGAAFILVYFGCVLLLGIPGMVSEFIIGRHAQSNAARAYASMGHRRWRFIGYLGILTSTIILGFYAVVAGWCLQYLFASFAGKLNGDAAYVINYFKSFSSDPFWPCLWAVGFVLITHLVVSRGVNKGIERVSKLLMPLLLLLLIIIVVASCLLPGAEKGISFLLKPDFSKVSTDVFLEALGQAFFSLSLGTACLCTYSSYFKRLIFITLPNVFQQAFGGMPVVGYVISIMFYALLVFAALTSTVSMHEIGTVFFHEELKITRQRAAWILTSACALLAIFCSFSVGAYTGLQLFGMSLMDFCDFLTAQLMLPTGAFLTSIMLGWFVNEKLIRDEFTNGGTIGVSLFRVWRFTIRFIVPLCIILIFLHQFGIL